MNTSVNTPTLKETPSTVGKFLSSFRSGAVNSSLMLGIFSAVSMAFTAITAGTVIGLSLPLGFGVMGITVLTTGLFSGIMGVKKAKESASEQKSSKPNRTVITAPSASLSQELAQSPDIERRTNWASSVGRSADSNVAQILANGSMSDKDRASAILAERQNAASSSTSIV